MEEDEVQDTYTLLLSLTYTYLEFLHRSISPFNTSRTWVVSAKISRKYSGGVLRGSIPAMTRATKLVGIDDETLSQNLERYSVVAEC